MVFASLLEYAAVSYIGNRCKRNLRLCAQRDAQNNYQTYGERSLGNGLLNCKNAVSSPSGEIPGGLHTVRCRKVKVTYILSKGAQYGLNFGLC